MIGMERDCPPMEKCNGVRIQYPSKKYEAFVLLSVLEYSHCYTCFETIAGLMVL